MDAKRFFYVCAALSCLAIDARIATGQSIVGTAKFHSEGSAALVVLSNGDFYKAALSGEAGPATWVRAGSFGTAVVGVARIPGEAPERVYAISSTGELLWASSSSGTGRAGNIFELAGRPRDAVMALGTDGEGVLIASTQRGDVYLANTSRMHLPGSVIYAGNIYGAAAAPKAGTWGQVKSTYR